MFRLETTQQINSDIETVWKFFSNPKNLSEITPKEMNFVIKTPNLTEMYQGQIIEYTVSPLLGFPMTWVTEIAVVEKHKFFIDNQLVGPYTLWHHQHFFTENETGVLMQDIVHFKIPFGILGKWLGNLFIFNKVKRIFDYRYNIIEQKFNIK